MTEQVERPIVYIDANPFIYAVEGDNALSSAINDLFLRLKAMPGIAATSELTLAEVLAKAPTPLHHRSYLDLLVWSGIFDLRPVTRDVLYETVDYRRATTSTRSDGTHSMPKLPDAIHGVTAIRTRGKKFLSADGRVRLPDSIQLVEATASGIAQLSRDLA